MQTAYGLPYSDHVKTPPVQAWGNRAGCRRAGGTLACADVAASFCHRPTVTDAACGGSLPRGSGAGLQQAKAGAGWRRVRARCRAGFAGKEKAAGEPAAFPDSLGSRSYYFLASSAASLAWPATSSAALAASAAAPAAASVVAAAAAPAASPAASAAVAAVSAAAWAASAVAAPAVAAWSAATCASEAAWLASAAASAACSCFEQAVRARPRVIAISSLLMLICESSS